MGSEESRDGGQSEWNSKQKANSGRLVPKSYIVVVGP